jgi:hypothetical protein
MSPQGGPPSASMAGYPTHQSPVPGPSPGGRGYAQNQGGFPSAGFAPQGYPNMQMPVSAGGYGQEQNSAGWGQPQGGAGYPRNPPHNAGNNFGGGY